MTLDRVPRYDPARLSAVGDRAVVVGGSMAGLLAARVLADGFDRVTVIERDDLPEAAAPRRGVPQGHHVHVLLEAGRATIEDLFPGYGEALLRAGAHLIDIGSELRHFEDGGFLAPPASRMEMYCASRPLIEGVVRSELESLDTVDVRAGCQFTDYRYDTEAGAIEGVDFRGEEGEEAVAADLVVDATGRSSRTPRWLEAHGFESPRVDEVTVDVAYSSITLERDPGDRQMIFAPPTPPRTLGGAAFPIEGDRWLVTLGGAHDTDPPQSVAAFPDFADRFPIPHIKTILEDNPVRSEAVDYHPFPSNRRHRYGDLDRFPAGLVVLGDAIASFNPIYGQGMSVAALEALELNRTLADGGLAGIGPRFFDRADDVVDVAWSMAVGADQEFEATTGPTPRGAGVFNRYLSRLVQRAHTDGQLSEAFYRVVGMEVPPSSLLGPRTLWRTLSPRAQATTEQP